MNARNRLNQLNLKHGLKLSILQYNAYYGVDLLRCTIDEFQATLEAVRVSDALRLSTMHDIDASDIVELQAA